MNERILQLKPYPMVELARRKARLIADGVHVIDFGTGDPIEPTAPFIRQALADAIPEVSQYPSIRGTPELRAAFASWFQNRFGVALDPETDALPSRGSKEAMFHLPLITVDASKPRRRVVHPVPGYPVMEIGSFYADADVTHVPLNAGNDYLMRPEDVPDEALATAQIVWLNYPHNPTGKDCPDALWRAWVDARDAHGFVLCSDECYTEIYFGERPRSLLEFGRTGCLVFHSLSKRSGMTAYRSGMVAGDPEIIAQLARHRAAMGQAQTEWVQAASVAAWSDEAHVAARRAAFAAKRDLLRTGLARLGLAVYDTTSTFYLWVRVPEGATDAGFAQSLLDRGLVVSPGSFFGPGNEEFIRFALVPNLADCEAALERMATL